MSSSISPVVAGGLACSDGQGLLNLNPPEVRGQIHHRQQVRDLVLVGLLLIAVCALGASLLGLQLSRQRRVAGQLDTVMSGLAPTARQLQEKIRSVQLVGSMLDDRRRLAVTLAGVFRSTPQAIVLESVAFERAKEELVLRGNAASTQEVLDYIKNLKRLKDVSGAELRYSTRRTTPTGERTDFELVLHQRGALS